MTPGIFQGTFYILQEPLNVDKITIRLNRLQTALYDQIIATERMQCLMAELGAIGDGLIYHKDNFQLVHGAGVQNYQPLINHSNQLTLFHK